MSVNKSLDIKVIRKFWLHESISDERIGKKKKKIVLKKVILGLSHIINEEGNKNWRKKKRISFTGNSVLL